MRKFCYCYSLNGMVNEQFVVPTYRYNDFVSSRYFYNIQMAPSFFKDPIYLNVIKK